MVVGPVCVVPRMHARMLSALLCKLLVEMPGPPKGPPAPSRGCRVVSAATGYIKERKS